MAFNYYTTNPNAAQPSKSSVDAAIPQHHSDLSQSALYWYYTVANAMQPPPALPAGCIGDEYVGRCLLSHLRDEFPKTKWPHNWSDLKPDDATEELVTKLQRVARRRTFTGSCEICVGWKQDDDCPAGPPVKTLEVANAFLEFKCSDGLGESSAAKYKGSLRTFAKKHTYLPVTPEPIEAYLAARPASSSKRYLYALLSELYQFAHDRFNIPNVMGKRPRKGKSKESDYLTLEQLRTLLSPIDDDRLRGMVDIMVGQGFRRSEVCRANVSDIVDDKILVHGKEAEEWMPLYSEVRDAVLKQAGERSGNEPLFVSTTTGRRLCPESINKIVKQAFERAGINGIRPSPHTLRHTYCTLMLSAGCDRYSVELLMRHRTQNTTDIYAHTDTETRLRLLRPKLEQFCPLRLVNGHKPGSTGNLL